jgi:hypothetical protein
MLVSAGDIEDMILADLAEHPDARVVLIREDGDMALGSYKRISAHLGDAAIGKGSRSLVVRECTHRSVDPSLHVVEVGGSLIGVRVDRLYWYCSTPPVLAGEMGRKLQADESRLEVWTWFQAQVLSRMTDGSTAYVVGAPADRGDVEMRLADELRWPLKTIPLTPEARWPKGQALGGLDWLRRSLGPIEAARQIDCVLPTP